MIKNIEQLENNLNSSLRQFNILSDLEISQEEFLEIQSLLKSKLDQTNAESQDESLSQIKTSLSYYMVWFGIYRYKGGDYWQNLCGELNIQININKINLGANPS